MSMDPQQVVRDFASAVAAGDDAAAQALSSPPARTADHGDSPARFFRKARHPTRGFRIEVLGVRSAAESTRAAVEVELIHPERGPFARVTVLGEGEPWRLAGVSKRPRFVDAFLAGHLPALLDFDALPPDVEAADSLVSISALAQQALHGNEQARALVESLMNESEAGHKVIGWLHNAARLGWQVRVQEARKVAGVGRSVARALVVKPDPGREPEPVWLYAESGPPLSWYAHTTYFSPDALLA